MCVPSAYFKHLVKPEGDGGQCVFVHQPHDNDGLHVYEFSDLDQLEGKDCLLVCLFARVPGRELFVNLLVIIVRKIFVEVVAVMLTFSVSSSSKSSGARDSRNAQSGCLGAISLFSSHANLSLTESKKNTLGNFVEQKHH